MDIVKARLYRRVSTDEQAASGYSLGMQQERLEAFCVSQGWVVAGTYMDDGYSAKNLDRPAFKQMMKEIGEGEVILVYRLDRLTRSIRDLEYLLQLSEDDGIYFRSATENIDTTTASGRMFVRLIIQFAQFEREVIGERSVDGRRKKAQQGEWGGGPAPFGYTTAPSGKMKAGKIVKTIVPDPQTRHIVPMLYERYLAGHGVRSLCVWFNDELGLRTAKGSRFGSSTIVRMLTNPIYAGDIRHGARTKRQTLIVEGKHEPLVDRQLFDAVQETFQRRKLLASRQATGVHVLTGVGRCGVCGAGLSALSRTKNGVQYAYYRCLAYANDGGCGLSPLTSVSARKAEKALVDEVSRISRPSGVDDLVADFRRNLNVRQDDVDQERERLRRDLVEAETAIIQWKRLFEKGAVPDDEYLAEVAPHKERVAAIKARLAEIEATTVVEPDWQTLQLSSASFQEAWDGFADDLPSRKALVQQFMFAHGLEAILLPGGRLELRLRRSDAGDGEASRRTAGDSTR